MEQQYGPYAPPPSSHEIPAPAPPTNSLAIASLVLSLLGLIGVLPLLGTVLGLIFGYSARNQIARSQGTQGGEGLAKAGIIIGWVTVGLWALALCVFLILGVAVPIGGSICVDLEPILQSY